MDAAVSVDRARPTHELSASFEVSSGGTAELRVRFASLPTLKPVRSNLDPSRPADTSSVAPTGADLPKLGERHLSAGVLAPYQSTAPPHS